MNCRECQELVAAAARGGWADEPREAAAHLARCAACREFREQAAAVGSALGAWKSPQPREARVATCKAVLLARFATEAATGALTPAAEPWRRRAARFFRHPALIGVLGAAASVAGAAVAPDWVQQAAIGWAAGAAVLTSLVLLCHGRPVLSHGGRI